MRRKELEVTEIRDIEEIIKKSHTCRIGLCDGSMPYVVPMSFGYRNGCVYLHCAKEGRKIDIIKSNNNVCFEVDADFEIIEGGSACSFSNTFSSVIGFGKAYIVEDPEEKKKGLDVVMEHYTGKETHEYSDGVLERVCVIRIELESMTGKRRAKA